MYTYFARKYVSIWLVLLFGVGFMLSLSSGIAGMVPMLPAALVFSGLLAFLQLWWEFRRNKIWPAYHNIGINAGVLFLYSMIVVVGVSLVVWAVLLVF